MHQHFKIKCGELGKIVIGHRTGLFVEKRRGRRCW